METTQQKNTLAYMTLSLAQLMASINIVGSKYLVQLYSMFFLLCTRFFIATVFLLCVHGIRRSFHSGPFSPGHRIRDLNKKDWFYIIAQGACGGVIVNYLLLYGLNYTNANSAGIITSALPAVVTIFSIIFLRERLTLPLTISISFAVLGLLVMNLGKWHANNVGGLFGDFIIVISLLPEAAYYVFAKLHVNRLPIFVFSALINGINFMITFIVMLCIKHIPHEVISLHNLIILIIVGLTSGLFYILWYIGCKKVSGIMSALTTVGLPIFTILVSWLFLKEELNFYQVIGLLLVIVSIVFTAMRNQLFQLLKRQS